MSRPFWLDEPAAALPRVRLDGPPDVAVVGGGITGCTCALRLAEAGLRVRLYEAREIGSGASGRNGGFALRGTAAPYPAAVESMGRERARELWRLTEEALEEMAGIAGDALRRTGSLRLAADEEEREELAAEHDALIADGFEVEWVDEPLPGFGGALLHPPDASLHPTRFVRSLALAAAGAAEFVEHSRVESVDELDAERVVVATDGYPSGLLGPLEGLIIPARGQMIATEPLPERLFDKPHYGRHGFDYWQQLDDGRITAGGFRDADLTAEFTAVEETTPVIQDALERLVHRLVGRSVPVTHRWSGIFGLVPDLLPVVGPLGDGRVWLAGGYSGHGNVLGFLCGGLVADMLLGRELPAVVELFDPARLLA